jgi:hypothetical protein
MSDTATAGTTVGVGQASEPRICKVTGVVRRDEGRLTIEAHSAHLLDSVEAGAFAASVADYAVTHGLTCVRSGSTLFDLFAHAGDLLPQDSGDIRVIIHMIATKTMRTIQMAERGTSLPRFKTTDNDVDVYTIEDVTV